MGVPAAGSGEGRGRRERTHAHTHARPLPPRGARLRAVLREISGGRGSLTFAVPGEKYSFISIGATVNSDQATTFATVKPTAFTFIFCHFGNYVNQGPQLK